jgi:hypothetical protein
MTLIASRAGFMLKVYVRANLLLTRPRVCFASDAARRVVHATMAYANRRCETSSTSRIVDMDDYPNVAA